MAAAFEGRVTGKDVPADGSSEIDALAQHRTRGIVSNLLYAPYRSGRSKAWLKIKNPNAPETLRLTEANDI